MTFLGHTGHTGEAKVLIPTTSSACIILSFAQEDPPRGSASFPLITDVKRLAARVGGPTATPRLWFSVLGRPHSKTVVNLESVK